MAKNNNNQWYFLIIIMGQALWRQILHMHLKFTVTLWGEHPRCLSLHNTSPQHLASSNSNKHLLSHTQFLKVRNLRVILLSGSSLGHLIRFQSHLKVWLGLEGDFSSLLCRPPCMGLLKYLLWHAGWLSPDWLIQERAKLQGRGYSVLSDKLRSHTPSCQRCLIGCAGWPYSFSIVAA